MVKSNNDFFARLSARNDGLSGAVFHDVIDVVRHTHTDREAKAAAEFFLMTAAVMTTSAAYRSPAALLRSSRIVVSSVHNDTRYMMRVLLEMWGYQVFETSGLDETIASARDNHAHLILMDTSREFNNDLEMISVLSHSEALGATPVIVMSGYSQQQYKEEALKCGAAGVLIKPLDLDLFESYIETALNG